MEAILKTISNRVVQGKVALVLGSGASVGATLPEDRSILLGEELKELLCDQFLAGKFKEADLKHVSDMAISDSSLFEVQDYIREYFQDIEPAAFHTKVPDYKWRAIFTTNYDRLIETCYERSTSSVQTPEIIINNDDRIDATRIDNNLVPIIKLHGCITRTRDESLPLILTVDQYNESLSNKRNRLFKLLFEIAYENTLVFVGHSLQDHNLRAVMRMLHTEAPNGQRHYLLKPGIDDVEVRFWARDKITAVDATFQDLVGYLEKYVPASAQQLSAVRPNSSHPIQKTFATHLPPSDELIELLGSKVQYVSEDIAIRQYKPEDFFRGVELGWYPLVEELPIKRGLEENIFQSVIFPSDLERDLNTELVVIKAEAGSGKTILLRQIAWRGSLEREGVFLWVDENASIDVALVEEICSKSNERVFVVWDDAANNFIEIMKFVSAARNKRLRVTVLTSERHNEWNMRCDGLDQYVTSIFELRYLSEREIEELLVKLETHDSLGPNLKSKSFEERKRELKEIHGRQLLVALHEATMGEPFEDIVFDEYSNLEPIAAQQIYLTICTLNRLRVPVRAGLISRIHKISFERFRSQFHQPLERVVFSKSSDNSDISYIARHPEVAEIVFKRALNTSELRYNEYIQILSKLNISYSSDYSSFRQLIKARSLMELFSSNEDIEGIYKYAEKFFGLDVYLLQQTANYERLRNDGSLAKAADLLAQALKIAPHDKSILHSIAVVWRDKAKEETDIHLRARYRRESRAHLEEAMKLFGADGYAMASLIELGLHDLEDLFTDSSTTETVIDEAVRNVQRKLTENKQKYPEDAHTLSLEARLSTLLKDHVGTRKALEKSFELNDREPYLAIRLADIYSKDNEPEKALDIIQKALDRRRTDYKLNYHLAELLKAQTEVDIPRLVYHYRRAFTPGDSNYDAQFWYARYAFESVESKVRTESRRVFEALRLARLPHSQRIKIRDYIGGKNNPNEYLGNIIRKRMAYGFIKVDGTGDEIFCSSNEMLNDLWEASSEADRVKFNIGFSMKGAVCCNVVPMSTR